MSATKVFKIATMRKGSDKSQTQQHIPEGVTKIGTKKKKKFQEVNFGNY